MGLESFFETKRLIKAIGLALIIALISLAVTVLLANVEIFTSLIEFLVQMVLLVLGLIFYRRKIERSVYAYLLISFFNYLWLSFLMQSIEFAEESLTVFDSYLFAPQYLILLLIGLIFSFFLFKIDIRDQKKSGV